MVSASICLCITMKKDVFHCGNVPNELSKGTFYYILLAFVWNKVILQACCSLCTIYLFWYAHVKRAVEVSHNKSCACCSERSYWMWYNHQLLREKNMYSSSSGYWRLLALIGWNLKQRSCCSKSLLVSVLVDSRFPMLPVDFYVNNW